ncbi:hypothetical protein Tco_0170625 [Tanacetum coccineum]
MDYMETEEAVVEGRISSKTKELNVVIEEKGSGEKGGSTENPVSTDVPEVSTVKIMLSDKTKLKGVAIKEVEQSDKPARLILTLKPLPAIDPKDKGKGVLEEPELAKKITKSDFDAA